MQKFDKLVLASEMFIEAHQRFMSAQRDTDYVSTLLLAGAVHGIVSPLVSEKGEQTFHQLLARIADVIAEPGEPRSHPGVYSAVYNGVRHAGSNERRRRVVPSKDLDLEIHTDLRYETGMMLDAAREDFRKVVAIGAVRTILSKEFRDIVDLDIAYALEDLETDDDR